MCNSITVFHPDCGTCRILLSYIGYITPSVLLLILLVFYDAKTVLCYKFESTFLLDNTQQPSSRNIPATEIIEEQFQTFLNYAENYSYDYDLDTTENNVSWKYYLGNLSIPNKYFLMKTLEQGSFREHS